LSTMEEIHEGFLALCVSVGREALVAMMEQDRTAKCGPKWLPNPDRKAGRGGSARGEVTLGGRRIGIRRLRAHAVSGEELELPSFVWAARRDPLNAHTLAAVAAGVSTRKYGASLDALPATETARAVSRSSVSRRFVALSTGLLKRWLARRVDKMDWCAVMIDGIVFRKRCIVIALGITAGGQKHVLGFEEGSTENSTVVQGLLGDLIERGLPTARGLLFVIDGSKALSKAIKDTFGQYALIQRCQVHKRRNVRDYLPKSMQAGAIKAMHDAYTSTDAAVACKQLQRLAAALESDHPGAAKSLQEGLEETLTLQRLGITGVLYKSLRSTNTLENLNGSVVLFTRNVRRWRDGKMLMRWVGAALHEAEAHFNRLKGYKQLNELAQALRKHDQQIAADKNNLDTRRKAA
jgi:putative transposase